ncbi:transferase [Klebsiella pneumoniae subsp. rhinoscleromatis]|nr:transferase [Klebsiella pneumoniae subsp. rhinoscleromatis]
MRKYRLSEQTRQYCYEEEHGKQSVTLRQIVALIDFADVKAGSEGGWVDEECALSQQGSAGSTMSTAWSSPGRASATRPA